MRWLGDQTLFVRSDAMELAWKLLTPILNKWEQDKEKGLLFYEAGSWGTKRSK